MTALRRLTPARWGLIALLLLSFGLRLVLVMRGGQDFWTDESRYGAAVKAWLDWSAGLHREAVLQIIGSADHLGFKALMLGPAWVQLHVNSDVRFPSVIVSLFSVANIYWVWRIARGMGADEREAGWSALAMACANSMFYWARHLMPYDVSLFWALAGAAVALRPQPAARHSFLAGFLGFLAFITYNGYWAIVACILIAHVVLAWPRAGIVLKRAALGLVGLGGSFFVLLVLARCAGVYLLASYLDFADTINQGDYNDGYVVFFDYLWRTEGFTALIWAGTLLGFGWMVRSGSGEVRRRGATWVIIILALAGILIVGSNVLDRFVVYGRLVRQVVPFCALLVGWAAARCLPVTEARSGQDRRWPWGEGALLLLLLGAAAWSMATPLAMDFPNSFAVRAIAVRQSYEAQHGWVAPGDPAAKKFRVLYDAFIWPYPDEKPLAPPYLVLLSRPHPLAWRPYLYEGFNREQRTRIEATDIRMRLVLLQD